MKLAQISLIDYFATDLHLGTNPGFATDKPLQFDSQDLQIEVTTRRQDSSPDEGSRWQVTLEVRHQPASQVNFPYSYRVILVGQFNVAPTVKPEDEARFVKIQGASVLYGMTREIVRVLTGRGPYRPVILPTVSFYEAKPVGTAPSPEAVPQAARKRTAKKAPSTG